MDDGFEVAWIYLTSEMRGPTKNLSNAMVLNSRAAAETASRTCFWFLNPQSPSLSFPLQSLLL